MSRCVKCGADAAKYEFRMLEVQTLPVRDLTGEHRVQALGNFRHESICRDCARRRLEQILHPGAVLRKKLLPFAVVLMIGIAVLAICWGGATALLVMGGAGIICGLLGMISAVQTVGKQKNEFAALSPQEREYRAAWDCLVDALPKKDGDNNLTYIPVDSRTLAMKNGDLMIAYDLLPAIAIKAWNMIHGKE